DLKSSKPYLVLEIDWPSPAGTLYYLDRPSNSFDASGTRAPTVETPKVIEWPRISLSLKEGQVGATEQCQVTLDDTGGAVTSILNGGVKQRSVVAVWRLFDDPTTVWPDDAALIFSGTLRPFDWSI